jgi:hypothetical protein
VKIGRKDYAHSERADVVRRELRTELALRGLTLSDGDQRISRADGAVAGIRLKVAAVPGASYLVATWGGVSAGAQGDPEVHTEPRSGYQIEQLADLVATWAQPLLDRSTRDASRNARVAVAQEVATRLNKDFGNLGELTGARIVAGDTGALRFVVARSLGEEQARRLLEVARELGII